MTENGYSLRRFDLRQLLRTKNVAFLSVLFTVFMLLPSVVNAMGAKQKVGSVITGHTVIDGFSSPESVTSDGHRFYVSNVGVELKPSEKDGDGFISLLSAGGKVLERKFISGLNAPKGMVIAGGVLYVADVDRVLGFDLKTRKRVFDLDFSHEGTAYLNDITVVDDTTLLVSATDIGNIYAVTLGAGKRYTPVAKGITGVNGLVYDTANERLLLVNFVEGKGALGFIPFAGVPGDLQNLSGPVGLLDGLALLPDGRVLFSDWVKFGSPGRLNIFDVESGKMTFLKLKEDAIGPADFFYDKGTNKLWLPRMVEGKVMVQELK